MLFAGSNPGCCPGLGASALSGRAASGASALSGRAASGASALTGRAGIELLLCSEVKEEHSEQNEEKVYELRLEVLLVEDGGSEEEADDDRTTTNHAHDADHGSRQTQCVEI